jgi:hypothetical protein
LKQEKKIPKKSSLCFHKIFDHFILHFAPIFSQNALLKKENPSLRLSQLKQMLFKEWQKHPKNPIVAAQLAAMQQ